jgi:hypothetical protein
MSAATSTRSTVQQGNEPITFRNSYPIGAGAKLIQGCLAALKAGYLVNASADPTQTIVGVALYAGLTNLNLDNTGGGAGAFQVTVTSGVFPFANSAGADAITAANVGAPCYVVDNQSVALTSANGTRPVAGIIVNVAGPNVMVEIRPSAIPTAIPLPALPAPIVRAVRGVVTTNVASLAAFAGVAGGTPVDGVTYAAGDRLLLAGQTTASQNGIYVVGAVAAGVAPLTRPADYIAGLVVPAASIVEASEGTIWAGSTWKIYNTGVLTVDTTAIAFAPRVQKGTQALVAGAATVSGLFASPTAQAFANDTTAAAAVKAVLTSGPGTGTLVLTGTGTDIIAYAVVNF